MVAAVGLGNAPRVGAQSRFGKRQEHHSSAPAQARRNKPLAAAAGEPDYGVQRHLAVERQINGNRSGAFEFAQSQQLLCDGVASSLALGRGQPTSTIAKPLSQRPPCLMTVRAHGVLRSGQMALPACAVADGCSRTRAIGGVSRDDCRLSVMVTDLHNITDSTTNPEVW